MPALFPFVFLTIFFPNTLYPDKNSSIIELKSALFSLKGFDDAGAAEVTLSTSSPELYSSRICPCVSNALITEGEPYRIVRRVW
jgi:hypothetical protein